MNSRSGNTTGYNGGLGFAEESGCACSTKPTRSRSSWGQQSESDLLAGTTEMDRIIVTRPSLVESTIVQKPIVLLTGAWPLDSSRSVVELDVTIDHRYTWIDQEAERLAEMAGGGTPGHAKSLPAPWVNILALRYYLVRLLRVIEFFSKIEPPAKGERVLVIADKADRDDVAILATLCRRTGAVCSVQWHGKAEEATQPAAEPEEGWRKTLRRLVARLPDRVPETGRRRRVVLCGNPRFLDPLCHVLADRKCHVWWLYDRLAVKPFLRWYSKGINQLTCQDDSPVADESEGPIALPKLEFRGMDLRGLVSDWLEKRLATRRNDQRRWQRHIEGHFRRIKPDFLVMDEDATPMKRIALEMARRNGGKSYVVQHGAPVARFGFVPLAADGFFAWGQSTREQLQLWNIPAERIFITGSPAHDAIYQTLRKISRKRSQPEAPPRILLLATVPPRDDRPDVIEMNMNSRTYSEMVEAAFVAAEAVPGATLVVKPHPRSQDDSATREAAARHPRVKVEHSRATSFTAALRGIDCVLSCLSSAGIEATLAGLPVIQLLPRGAGRILPHESWGLAGSASTSQELLPLIQKAIKSRGRCKNAAFGDVFANASFWGRISANVPDSATRIADILLDYRQKKQIQTESRTNQEQGSSTAEAKR